MVSTPLYPPRVIHPYCFHPMVSSSWYPPSGIQPMVFTMWFPPCGMQPVVSTRGFHLVVSTLRIPEGGYHKEETTGWHTTGVDNIRWKPWGWIPRVGNHGLDIISNQLSTNYVFLLINKNSILKKIRRLLLHSSTKKTALHEAKWLPC